MPAHHLTGGDPNRLPPDTLSSSARQKPDEPREFTYLAGQPGRPLLPDWYAQPDSLEIARALIGKVLCRRLDTPEGHVLTSGVILETEAYKGTGDAACHAHMGRFTERTKVMYGPPGRAYVYLCYGIHHLFNIVTGPAGQADAVLIRAIEPLEGIEVMAERRGVPASPLQARLTRGPGSVARALAIDRGQYGDELTPEAGLWIEDRGLEIEDGRIARRPRIAVDYAGDDAHLPWRMVVRGTKWVTYPPKD